MKPISVMYFFLFFSIISCFNKKSIRDTTFWVNSGKGIIFHQEINFPSNLAQPFDRFTPSINEVSKAEDIFYQYLLASNAPKSKKHQKVNLFIKYRRQYFGLVNSDGERLIFINLLNFNNRKLAAKYFESWKSEYVIGLGAIYEENSARFIVNIDKKTIEQR